MLSGRQAQDVVTRHLGGAVERGAWRHGRGPASSNPSSVTVVGS